jgi:2-polyprenyl-6-methoxyphenol hydroxylase-like FAD-dependent oxidoreductase
VLAGATEQLPPHISGVLRTAEPLGGLHHRQYPASVWRRYDKLQTFPAGLLVIGDAMCSFNPVYGQGMTAGALQARALQKVLTDTSPTELSRNYFRAAARQIGAIWQANRLNYFAATPTDGWTRWPQRVFNSYTTAHMAAASTDERLTESFLRVLQGVDSGVALAAPKSLARILTSARRRR